MRVRYKLFYLEGQLCDVTYVSSKHDKHRAVTRTYGYVILIHSPINAIAIIPHSQRRAHRVAAGDGSSTEAKGLRWKILV